MSAVEQVVTHDESVPPIEQETVIEGELLPPENALDVYRPFYTELAKLKQSTSKLVFDYASKEGLKHAKSYAFNLRKSRKPMKDAHDNAKVEFLEVIKRIDSQYNELDANLDEIIEIVDGPIKAAEAREAERIDGHQKVLDYIACYTADASMASADIQRLINSCAAVVVDESLEEFQAEAAALHAERTALLQAAFDGAQKREAEEAELAALRAEKWERDTRDNEARIAKEAADKAKAEAEAAAERGRIAAEAAANREREAAEAREKADRARIEAAEAEAKAAIETAAKAQRESEEKAAQAVRDTEERIRLEREQAEANARLEQQRREADMAHKAEVNRGAVAALVEHTQLGEVIAKSVVTAIARGLIPNVTVRY